MTIQARTCANCAAYNPRPTGNAPACWEKTEFKNELDQAREPEVGDTCLAHLSFEEDIAQDRLLRHNRGIVVKRASDGYQNQVKEIDKQIGEAVATFNRQVSKAQRQERAQ